MGVEISMIFKIFGKFLSWGGDHQDHPQCSWATYHLMSLNTRPWNISGLGGGCINDFHDILPISVFGYSGPSPRLMTYFLDILWHRKQEYIGNEIRIQCVLRLGNFLFYWGWWVIMTYWFRNQVPHLLPVTVNICFQRQHVSIFDCSQVITIYIVYIFSHMKPDCTTRYAGQS